MLVVNISFHLMISHLQGMRRPFKRGAVPVPGLRNKGPKHQFAPGVFGYSYCISAENVLKYYNNDINYTISELRRSTGLNFVLDEATRVTLILPTLMLTICCTCRAGCRHMASLSQVLLSVETSMMMAMQLLSTPSASKVHFKPQLALFSGAHSNTSSLRHIVLAGNPLESTRVAAFRAACGFKQLECMAACRLHFNMNTHTWTGITNATLSDIADEIANNLSSYNNCNVFIEEPDTSERCAVVVID